MKRGILEIVELAYRFDIATDEWLATICEAASELTPGSSGAMIYEFDASERRSGVEVGSWHAAGVSEQFVTSTLELNNASTQDEVNLFYRSGVTSGTVSEFLRMIGEEVGQNESYGETTAVHGYPDSFGLTASAPDHRGLVINAPLEQPQGLDERVRLRWRQVGAHLQTAYRLRGFINSIYGAAEAVIEPGGVIVDAEGEATSRDGQAVLSRAVTAIDQGRSSATDLEEALEVWTALVDGRWSLVESFDTDGRRFYLAIPNGAQTQDLFALTERERQVVAHVAQGDSNKWIAYQLGVTPATVSKLLGRALDKLGLASRRELILLYHRLESEKASSK